MKVGSMTTAQFPFRCTHIPASYRTRGGTQPPTTLVVPVEQSVQCIVCVCRVYGQKHLNEMTTDLDIWHGSA